MRTSFTMGRLFGIPIRINYTWFLIIILMTLSLSLAELPAVAPGFPAWLYWPVGVLGSLLFFGSVLAHELAHSLVARAQGTPVRDITLFLFGGVSSIEAESENPLKEILMAGVGPATSLVLALAFALLFWVFRPLNALVSGFFLLLTLVNGWLAIFNLLPGLPLDGGRVLRAVIWQTSGNYRLSTRIAATTGRVISFLLIGGGILWTFSGGFSGLWLALIGWFMDNAATQSYKQVILQDLLRGVTVADLMTPECARIPPGLSVATLVDGYVLHQGGRCFLVVEGDILAGMVTMHNIRGLPRERWPDTRVGEIMVPAQELVLAHPNEDAWKVLRRMDERNVNQLPVEENGRLIGLIARENLLRYVRAKAELGM